MNSPGTLCLQFALISGVSLLLTTFFRGSSMCPLISISLTVSPAVARLIATHSAGRSNTGPHAFLTVGPMPRNFASLPCSAFSAAASYSMRLLLLFRVFDTALARHSRGLVEHDSRRLRCSPFRPHTSHANFSPGARFPGARALIDFAHRLYPHMRARLQRFEHSEKRCVKYTHRFAPV